LGGIVSKGMVSVEVPPLDVINEIIIAADNDKAGIDAANKLAERLLKQGYKVKIAIPPKAGTDFNDVLLEKEQEVAL
jgi:DNA primase